MAAVGLAVGLTLLVLSVRAPAEAGESGGKGDPTRGNGPVAAGQSQQELVAAGRQLYLTACVSCHGIDGEGSPGFPSLQASGEASADFYLRTGRMPMAAPAPQPPEKPPAYNDTEIRQLVAYVGSISQGPRIPDVETDRGDLSEGRALYLANCAPCHNSASIGGAISNGRYAPSLQQVEPTQVGEAIRIGPGQMPQFGRDVFTDQQVDSIARYVEYLHKPDDPGGLNLGYTGPVAEGFVALLFGLGALVLVIRWITREPEPTDV